MTKVITVGNSGGSAGKTTTTVSLAALLAQAGTRVLVVDTDVQATATSWLGITPDETATIGDVMLGTKSIDEVAVATNTDNVWLVPAWRGLEEQVQRLAGKVAPQQQLAQAIGNATISADVMLVDSPGAGSIMKVATLMAADMALTVTVPGWKEIAGVGAFMSLVDEVTQARFWKPGLKTVGVVPCDVPPANAGDHYKELMSFMRAQEWADLMTPPIRQTVRVREALAAATPLPLWAPREPVTADYRAVVDWLTAKRVID